jgi:uncharacterized protein (DUF433 family)
MNTNGQYKYLAPRPESSYRQLFIKGTRIRAEVLYRHTVPSDDPEARTAEQVAADYDLPVEAVKEAIAYCESNFPEIARDDAMDERMMELTGMNHPEYKYNPKKYYKPLGPEGWSKLEEEFGENTCNNNGDNTFLETRHGSLYRQPFLKGTRIRAEIPYSRTIAKIDEVEGSSEPDTPEQIAQDFFVPVEAIHEAVDWCEKHWDVVIADHAREDRLFEAHGMNHPDYKWNPKKYYRVISAEERARIINDEPLS